MQQFLSPPAVESALLYVLLGVLVAVSMVFGYRRTQAKEARCRLLLGMAAACLLWAIAAIATAPLR